MGGFKDKHRDKSGQPRNTRQQRDLRSKMLQRVEKMAKKDDPWQQMRLELDALIELEDLFKKAKEFGINDPEQNRYGLLVIGGRAIGTFSGPHRHTTDIDVVVKSDYINALHSVLQALKYNMAGSQGARFDTKGISTQKSIGDNLVIPLTACVDSVYDMSSGERFTIRQSWASPNIGRVSAFWHDDLYADGIPSISAPELLILKLMTEEDARPKDIIDIGYLANTRTFRHLTDADAKIIAELCVNNGEEEQLFEENEGLAHHVARKITQKFLGDGGVRFAKEFTKWFARSKVNLENIRELLRDRKKAEELERINGWVPTVKMLGSRIERTERMMRLYTDFEERRGLIQFLGSIQVEIFRLLEKKAVAKKAERLKEEIRALPETARSAEAAGADQGQTPAPGPEDKTAAPGAADSTAQGERAETGQKSDDVQPPLDPSACS